MKPKMTDNEIELFTKYLDNSHRYLEFGVGGSTVLAADHVKEWIISIDSSKEWIENVKNECTLKITKPIFLHIDIGPIKEWSTPIDENTKYIWNNYHSLVWNFFPQSKYADLCLIDGRFRVACLAQIILNCSKNIIIGLHDFHRKEYDDINAIAQIVSEINDIAFFKPLPSPNIKEIAEMILDIHKEDYK